jgi:hypothetical protein
VEDMTSVSFGWVKDLWHIEIHAAEPSVLEPCSFVAEISVQTMKRCKSPGSDKITA